MNRFPEDFLYRELAELAYAIAKSDGHVQRVEIERFRQVMNEEFGSDSAIAGDWFEVMAQNRPSIKEAYENTLMLMKKNKSKLDSATKAKYLKIFDRVARAFDGLDEKEEFIIERFKEDVESL